MARSTIGFLIVALVSCQWDSGTEPSTDVQTSIEMVNGVERIRNSGTPPMWRLDPLLSLGSPGTMGPPAPDEFGLVTSAIWGPDNRVYVADAMNAEVKVFNVDGSLESRFGRKGAGPGEFSSLYSLAWLGDTLLTLDFGVGRVGLFDGQGRWLGQRGHPAGITGSPAQLRFYQTDRREAYAFSLSTSRDGMRRMLVRHTPSAGRDTLWHRSTAEALSTSVVCDHPNGSISFFDIPFAPRLLQHPGQGQLLAVVNTDRYQISFLTSAGDTVRIVERSLEAVPTTAAEWEAALFPYQEYRDENPGASCEPRGLRRPAVQPPVRDMLLDPAGKLWVEAVTIDGVFWEIFDPRGKLVGRVSGFPHSDRTAPYLAERHVVAVTTDSLDVQTVTVYELNR